MKIIGITGTIGAGKGTVVEYLAAKYGFKHYSVRDFLTEEIERRGLPINRDSMRLVGDEFRAHHHPGWVIEQLYHRAVSNGIPAVIESIRAIGEVDFLFSVPEEFILLAVDAEPRLRYERAFARKSATDNITYEQFLEKEAREMSDQDPTRMNIGGCMLKAHYTLRNDGTLTDLHQTIDQTLGRKLSATSSIGTAGIGVSTE